MGGSYKHQSCLWEHDYQGLRLREGDALVSYAIWWRKLRKEKYMSSMKMFASRSRVWRIRRIRLSRSELRWIEWKVIELSWNGLNWEGEEYYILQCRRNWVTLNGLSMKKRVLPDATLLKRGWKKIYYQFMRKIKLKSIVIHILSD